MTCPTSRFTKIFREQFIPNGVNIFNEILNKDSSSHFLNNFYFYFSDIYEKSQNKCMKTEMHWMQYSENMTPVGFDFPRNNTIFSNGSNSTAFSTILEENSPKNSSIIDEDSDEILDDYIFDRTDVRAIFITLYTIVFCCCFFGKFSFFNSNYIAFEMFSFNCML